jgi:type VI protein secretion system component VasK
MTDYQKYGLSGPLLTRARNAFRSFEFFVWLVYAVAALIALGGLHVAEYHWRVMEYRPFQIIAVWAIALDFAVASLVVMVAARIRRRRLAQQEIDQLVGEAHVASAALEQGPVGVDSA